MSSEYLTDGIPWCAIDRETDISTSRSSTMSARYFNMTSKQ